MLTQTKTKQQKVAIQKSFRTKIVIAVLLIIGVLFLVMLFGSIAFYQRIFRTQEISNQKQQIEKTAAYISSLQTSVENIAKQVAVSEALQENVSMPIEPSAEYFVSQDNINSALRTYTYIIEDIEEVLVYTKQGMTYSSATTRGEFLPMNENWYADFKQTKEKKGYTKLHQGTIRQNGRTNQMISYVLTYYSLSDHRNELGDLILNINYDEMEKNSQLDMDMLNGYILYNERGEKVLGEGDLDQNIQEIRTQKQLQWVDKTGNIYLCSHEMKNNWILVAEISSTQMQKQIWMMGMIITFVFLLLAFGISYAIIHRINRVIEPVKRLSEAAVQVGNGNFDVSVDVHTGDEIEVLADGFNQMARNVRNYTEASIRQEKIRRQIQVDQLMLQINPHFIYNTLNSIVYMARMQGNEDIEKFVNSFVLLLQSTLHVSGDVSITLEEELKNVQNYLILQKYRYLNKFELKLHCPEEYLDCLVPKVILQPLVENAIFHGIAPMEGEGILAIIVHQIGENLEIDIEDNGMGMAPETIEKLFTNQEKNTDGMRKIGISNVFHRIKEICGQQYGFTIESEIGKGTKVRITLPMKKVDVTSRQDWDEYF